jgi:hypothetical protein
MASPVIVLESSSERASMTPDAAPPATESGPAAFRSAGPGRQAAFRFGVLRARLRCKVHASSGREVRGVPVHGTVLIEPYKGRRPGCAPGLPGGGRMTPRGSSPSDFGPHRGRSGPLRRREVGRGCDASATDPRQGPPGVVCTPPAAAVRPLPGVRRPAPGPGLVPGGRRRARLGRVSVVSTIRA